MRKRRPSGYRTKSLIIPRSSTQPSNFTRGGKKLSQPESLEAQSYLLRPEIVKEIDYGIDMNLKKVGFIDSSEAKSVKSSSTTTSKETLKEYAPSQSSKYSIRENIEVSWTFTFNASRVLVSKSKYLTDEHKMAFVNKGSHMLRSQSGPWKLVFRALSYNWTWSQGDEK